LGYGGSFHANLPRKGGLRDVAIIHRVAQPFAELAGALSFVKFYAHMVIIITYVSKC